MEQNEVLLGIETFSTHFFTNEANKHFISAEDYKVFLASLEQILSEVNTKLLNNQVKYTLYVVANEEGGFWSYVGIAGTILGTPAILDTEFAHGFYIGLTGHDYDAREIGENVSTFMLDVTKGIFSKNATELNKIRPREINFDKAIDAKNKFYRMCAESTDIVGVSFSESVEPEITKKDFIEYIEPDIERMLPAEQFIDIVTIVKSVNIESEAKWSVRVGENVRVQSVDMQDEEFKKEFLAGNYALKQTKQDDKMTVLLERKKRYINGYEQDAGLAIVKVYKFNDTEILNIPKDIPHKKRAPQIDLFNYKEG